MMQLSSIKMWCRFFRNRNAIVQAGNVGMHNLQANFAATPEYTCPENNPVKHTEEHLRQFYMMSPEDQRRLFTYGGLTRDFLKQVKTFGECTLMIRSPSLEIINYLRAADYSNPAVRYVVYGRLGTGKTCTLAHVIHFCALQNWLMVHVPWVPIWTRISRVMKEAIPSQYKGGRIDLPVDAVAWLQQFKLQNSAILKELKPTIRNKYVWGKRESTEAGSPLTDIIEHGIERVKYSSDCVGAVLKEIKLLANDGTFKVLVAIDGVNAFFYDTRIQREDRSLVAGEDITLIHVFQKLLRNDWKNAAIVTTVDALANHSSKRESDFPRYLLGSKGFDLLDPYVPIATSEYSQDEVTNCLDYYTDKRWLQTERGKTTEGRRELIFLSGRNPGQLIQICNAW